MSCLAMGGIGCLVIVIALFLGGGAIVAKFFPQFKEVMADFQKDPERAAVMMMLKMIPNVEILTTDDAKREVTFKAKGNEEIYTMNFSAIKGANGKLMVKNSKGEEIEFDPNTLGGTDTISSESTPAAPALEPTPATTPPAPPTPPPAATQN